MSELRSESDYGTELDWDDETLEATLEAIEQRASLNRADSTAKTALQHVPIEVEAPEQAQIATRIADGPDEAGGAEGTDDEMTALRPSRLWELYRQRRGWGALSVSDLSGPAWCEVQHTYRLASKPFLPPLERPATITTSAGATIEIDTKRTVRREGILDRGKEIHRKIEKQVMGDVEEVKVNVSGKEEWWALRILNTIVCLDTLLATGKVRELPVVGWIGSHLVFGVIDEVERREVKRDSSTSKPLASASGPVRAPPRRKKLNAKKAATSERDDQSKLNSFFSILRSPAPAKGGEQASDAMVVDLTEPELPYAPPDEATPRTGTSSSTAATSSLPVAGSPSSPSWGFLLSDTKTRYNRSIPAPSESRPARLQLMLYHRLLSGLIDSGASEPSLPAATSFSWSRLYAHLSLAPDEPLSEDFLASIDPVLESSESLGGRGRLSTLCDYVSALQRVGALLRGDLPTALLDDLEIVYRLRSAGDKTFSGRRSKKRVASVAAIPALAPPTDAKARRLSADASARPADQAQDDADLLRAIALSLVDAEERAPAPKAAAADARAEEPSDIDSESQPEDSQLPFYANPSLPVIVSSSPERQRTSSVTEGGGPEPLGSAFTLPQNSQADAPDPQDGTLSKPILQPRYNLRKRSSSNAAISAPPVRATTPPSPTTPSSKASRKPSVPKSPKALGDKDLIGIDRFKNSPLELDEYLGRILAYWDGKRAPEGVALAQTHRCRSCEFEEGCEWRALKAAEVSREARERRLAREKRR